MLEVSISQSSYVLLQYIPSALGTLARDRDSAPKILVCITGYVLFITVFNLRSLCKALTVHNLWNFLALSTDHFHFHQVSPTPWLFSKLVFSNFLLTRNVTEVRTRNMFLLAALLATTVTAPASGIPKAPWLWRSVCLVIGRTYGQMWRTPLQM